MASPGNLEARSGEFGSDPLNKVVRVWGVFSVVAVLCFRVGIQGVAASLEPFSVTDEIT